MASMSNIEIKRELRLCLVKGKPALFHMWEEHAEMIEPRSVLKCVMGIIETDDGQVIRVHPNSIKFVDNKINKYCFKPEDKTAPSRDIEAIIYHYCCEGCSGCCNCFEDGKQRECEYYMEQYEWLTAGSSQEVQSE